MDPVFLHTLQTRQQELQSALDQEKVLQAVREDTLTALAIPPQKQEVFQRAFNKAKRIKDWLTVNDVDTAIKAKAEADCEKLVNAPSRYHTTRSFSESRIG